MRQALEVIPGAKRCAAHERLGAACKAHAVRYYGACKAHATAHERHGTASAAGRYFSLGIYNDHEAFRQEPENVTDPNHLQLFLAWRNATEAQDGVPPLAALMQVASEHPDVYIYMYIYTYCVYPNRLVALAKAGWYITKNLHEKVAPKTALAYGKEPASAIHSWLQHLSLSFSVGLQHLGIARFSSSCFNAAQQHMPCKQEYTGSSFPTHLHVPYWDKKINPGVLLQSASRFMEPRTCTYVGLYARCKHSAALTVSTLCCTASCI